MNKHLMLVTSAIFLVIIFFLTISYSINNRKLLTNSRADKSKSKAAIINGKFASPGDYPFFVRIELACGGTLIDKEWILTARHCIDDEFRNLKKPEEILVNVNYINASNVIEDIYKSIEEIKKGNLNAWNQHIVKVEKVIEYEPNINKNLMYYNNSNGWFQTYLNDIVLLKLKKKVESPTISFPKSNLYFDSKNSKGVILGAGNIKESNSKSETEPNHDLKYAKIIIKKNTETIYDVNKVVDKTINNRLLFSSIVDSWTAGAKGDSGGPVIIDNGQKKVQVGLLIIGDTSYFTVKSNTFLNVSYYSNWITEKTGILPESGTWDGPLIPTTEHPALTPFLIPTSKSTPIPPTFKR